MVSILPEDSTLELIAILFGHASRRRIRRPAWHSL